MNQVIAVSKSGVDASKETDPNKFIFHSDYNSFKIIKEGFLPVITVPPGTANTYNFPHNQSYTPMIEGFCKVDVFNYAVCIGEGMGDFPYRYFFSYIGTDSSNIYVQLYNGDSNPHDFKIKYYLFESPL